MLPCLLWLIDEGVIVLRQRRGLDSIELDFCFAVMDVCDLSLVKVVVVVVINTILFFFYFLSSTCGVGRLDGGF